MRFWLALMAKSALALTAVEGPIGCRGFGVWTLPVNEWTRVLACAQIIYLNGGLRPSDGKVEYC